MDTVLLILRIITLALTLRLAHIFGKSYFYRRRTGQNGGRHFSLWLSIIFAVWATSQFTFGLAGNLFGFKADGTIVSAIHIVAASALALGWYWIEFKAGPDA